MALRISRKMPLAAVFNVSLMLALAGWGYYSSTEFRHLQDVGAENARNATKLSVAAASGSELYRIIADAEINRDLAATAKDWAAKKAQVDARFQNLAGLGASEADALKSSQDGYHGLVQLFEQQMLPLLQKTNDLTQEMRDLDGKCDEMVSKMTVGLERIRDQEVAHAKSADDDFDARGQTSTLISVIISVVGILLNITIFFSLTRLISVPVRAMTSAMERLAGGDMAVDVPAKDGGHESQ